MHPRDQQRMPSQLSHGELPGASQAKSENSRSLYEDWCLIERGEPTQPCRCRNQVEAWASISASSFYENDCITSSAAHATTLIVSQPKMYEKAEDTCLEDVAAHLYALRKEPKAAVT